MSVGVEDESVAAVSARSGERRFDEAPSAPAATDELLEMALRKRRHAPRPVVRVFDVVTAVAVLFFAAPLLAVVGLAVAVIDGRPVLFRQHRIGRHGTTFEITKFRTMRVDAEQVMEDLLEVDEQLAEEFSGHRKLRHDPRLTRTGSFLRRSRLDEIPQMLSVIKGDMSVVGPRPVVPSEIRRYGGFASVAFSVKPGVTGRWQVSSSNADDYRERLFHDVSFATHHTFADIVRIAAKTPAVMVGSLGKKEFL